MLIKIGVSQNEVGGDKMQLNQFQLSKKEKIIEGIRRTLNKGIDWVTFEGQYPDFATVSACVRGGIALSPFLRKFHWQH